MKFLGISTFTLMLILSTTKLVGQGHCVDRWSWMGGPGLGPCLDNGTPCDPADDYYDLTVQGWDATPNPSNSYHVLVNGVILATFNYQSSPPLVWMYAGQIPADGTLVQISFEDVDDPTCTWATTAHPADPCSNGLATGFC